MIARLAPRTRFKQADKETVWSGLTQSSNMLASDLPHGAKISATGLFMPADLDEQQWQAVGSMLVTLNSGIQWALGDWWAYGFHAYGERKSKAIAKKLPYEFGSMMNLGWVARKIPASLRNEALSFSHHVAVAKLEPEDQKKWLDKAAKARPKAWSVKKLQQQIYDALQRDLEDKARAGDNSKQVSRWAFDFVERTARAKAGLRDQWSDDVLSSLMDDQISRLIEAASAVADSWFAVTTNLKEHVRRRSSSLPRERLPRNSDHLEAAE